ncbi:MAG: hypothetical protein CM15mP83_0690 [Flavobacteriaceae bacterium]|nr:MAG: hypothetical protein CM15mP83_0690 [Flavobacteriaceae bacterium]
MVFKSKQQVDNSRNNIKINFIEPNTKVIGEIHSESDFRIDGTLEGTVQTTGRVVVGQEGKVKGKISAQMQISWGLFEGQSKHPTFVYQREGTIEGKVVVGKLAVEAGATLNAQCLMKKSIKSLQPVDEKKSEKKPRKPNSFRWLAFRVLVSNSAS